jgi:hypothetical protein
MMRGIFCPFEAGATQFQEKKSKIAKKLGKIYKFSETISVSRNADVENCYFKIMRNL